MSTIQSFERVSYRTKDEPVSLANQRNAIDFAIGYVGSDGPLPFVKLDILGALKSASLTLAQIQPLLDCVQSLRDAIVLGVNEDSALRRCEIADTLLHRLYQLNGRS